MPPNTKGGKNYKKGKHTDSDPIIYERLPGQMYGRVIKLLGGCNALVFCNDNRERMCHIRGNMRKKVWISTGDIVLISTRDLANEGDSKVERGDICAKYDQRVIYKLRDKDRTINDKLFTNVEKTDNVGSNIPANNEDGFIFIDDDDNTNNKHSDSDADADSDSDLKKSMMPSNRAAQKKAMMVSNNDDDDDVNIDDI
jgi:translation initiation factor 1A